MSAHASDRDAPTIAAAFATEHSLLRRSMTLPLNTSQKDLVVLSLLLCPSAGKPSANPPSCGTRRD